MRYGSVCSGIEAATMAWHALGWEPAFFSEIEAFPRAVLEHRYPDVPLHGDFTTIEENQYGKIDLLVGGTPCQSFSVAGLRGGLDDERGNLALEFCRLAQRERPRWIVWENVPGVLSSNGGRDFGSILGALAELGYGLAYRVLDAQYFGVAQRRRRVFVVGYLGDWRRAAAVLFERHSMSGHPAPSREARKEAARAALSGAEERGGRGGDGLAVNISNGEPRLADVTGTLDCWSMKGRGSSQQQAVLQQWPADVACTLDTGFATKWGQNNQHVSAGCPMFVPDVVAFDTTQVTSPHNYSNPPAVLLSGDHVARTLTRRYDSSPCHDRGPDVVAFDTTQVTSPHNYSNPKSGDPVHPLAAGAHPPAIAIQERAICENPNAGPDGIGVRTDDAAYTLEARTVPQAVGYRTTGNDGAYETGDKIGALTTSTDPNAQIVAFTLEARTVPQAVAYPLDTQNMTEGHNSGGKGFGDEGDPSFTLTKGHSHAVAFDLRGREGGSQLEGPHDTANIRAASGGSSRSYVAASAVRRLTPVECERLQGFPDGFTAIPWRKKGAEDCPDGPRYKALGNSMAVPVMAYIGRRIQLIEDLMEVL